MFKWKENNEKRTCRVIFYELAQHFSFPPFPTVFEICFFLKSNKKLCMFFLRNEREQLAIETKINYTLRDTHALKSVKKGKKEERPRNYLSANSMIVYRNEICKRRDFCFWLKGAVCSCCKGGGGGRDFSHFRRDPSVSGISDVCTCAFVLVSEFLACVGRRRNQGENWTGPRGMA